MRILFFLSLAICAFAESYIPHVFHIIRWDTAPFSEEELAVIKSWTTQNPGWSFELWSSSSEEIPGIQKKELCKDNFPLTWDIASSEQDETSKLELLAAEIVFHRGGVWANPHLFACKPLEPALLDKKFIGYFYKDRLSLIAAVKENPVLQPLLGDMPSHIFQAVLKGLEKFPSKEHQLLGNSLVYPEGIFTPILSQSDSEGICFWQFIQDSQINKSQYDILVSGRTQTKSIKQIKRAVSSIRNRIRLVIALCFLNGIAFILYFILFKNKRTLSVVFLFVVLLFSVFLFKKMPSFHRSFSQPTLGFYEELCRNKLKVSCSKEDKKILHMFEELYALNFSEREAFTTKIPQVFHFIWIGEKPFPSASYQNLLSWKRYHPDWIFKFWTDRPERKLPFEWMEKHLIEEIKMHNVEELFCKSNNYGEKSDLLRYEILYKEGGIYVDHDVECFRSFEDLSRSQDFFAFLEPLHESVCPNVHCIVTNCLIGAVKGHPVFEETFQRLKATWDHFAKIFPYNDQLSTMLRVLYRSFQSFNLAVQKNIKQYPGKNTIFPAAYLFPHEFSSSLVEGLKKRYLIFADHQWKGEWYKDALPPVVESIISEIGPSMISLSKKINIIIKGNLLLLCGHSFVFVLLFFKMKKKKVLNLSAKLG